MAGPSSQSYLCKKWWLFAFSVLATVVVLIMIIMLCSVIHNYSDKSSRASNVCIIVFVGMIPLLSHVLGMVAVLKEHYGLVLTYSILLSLTTGCLIAAAVYSITFYWFFVVIVALMSGLAFSFAKDIRQSSRPNLAFVVNDQINPGYHGFLYPAQPNVVSSQMYHSAHPQQYLAQNNELQNGIVYSAPGVFHYQNEAPPPYSNQCDPTHKMQDIDLTQ